MIELKYLSKTFQMKDGAVKALQNINLTIPDGAIYGIIGMSGAGKSTLVRCINLRKRRREITMIFQQFNLLMQRTCLKNVCFPMELAGVKKAEAEKRAMELLEMVGLPDKANAYPAQLSGGMRQRAGIARTLAMNPKVILMDEPFSAVDHLTKCTLQEELINIRQAENKTVLFVTHDINEAVFLADRVVLLSPRPSTIQKIYEIPLEQKRGRNDPLLLKIAAEIAKDINSGGQDIPNNYWGNL